MSLSRLGVPLRRLTARLSNAHAGTTDAVESYLETLPSKDAKVPEAEVIAPFGGSYDFFDDMGFVGLPSGHAFMGGQKSIFSHFKIFPDYLEKMQAAYGQQRTEEILTFNRHNTLLYPSCTV
ncbi:MAG: benzoate/toluate 1,2-dioxygenase alpha subunit [Halioglobus sp.]|jgi:benzoate/toluate 1,2-dioxygenase alpha subunit